MAASATVRLRTSGMHCRSCSMLVQMELEDLDGVESAAADFAGGMTEVVYDPEVVSVEALINAIVAVGYGAEVAE